MTDDDLPEITDVQRFRLEPGDRLVVRYQERLTHQQAVLVRDRLLAWAGPGFPVLVLDGGASLEIVTGP